MALVFESLAEKIETSSVNGKLKFHIFAALAEFERNLIREHILPSPLANLPIDADNDEKRVLRDG